MAVGKNKRLSKGKKGKGKKMCASCFSALPVLDLRASDRHSGVVAPEQWPEVC